MGLRRTAVIDVVGLSAQSVGPVVPQINRLAGSGGRALIRPAFPAVTCSAQANYLTGVSPARHGIVGNGWYNRDLAEVHFWKQSHHLVQAREFWKELREAEPAFTCARLFWWFNMYSGAEYSITPRPLYPADGRKVFDIYTWPFSLRTEVKRELGEFPFPTFWGPAAGLDGPQGKATAASEWIAAAALWVERRYQPTLNLIYLPHLDYNLQRFGPADARVRGDFGAIDRIVGDLVSGLRERGVQVILLSEYGITEVREPVHLNRLFRKQGWLVVKDELGLEVLDCGASRVFAVADHQIAHVYLKDPRLSEAVREVVAGQRGVEAVYGPQEQQELGLRHARAGDLVAVAARGAWFTYYYWEHDDSAPDFARTVDIHRKPGYDPVELFIDPALGWPRLRIGWRLAQKRIGMRMLMDVVPLDAGLVGGSHGRISEVRDEWPVLITERLEFLDRDELDSTEVAEIIRRHLVGS